MALHPGDGLGKIIVQAVNRVLVGSRFAAQLGLPQQKAPQTFAHLRVVADSLRHDVRCARQSILRRLHALFRVDVLRRLLQRVRAVLLLGVQ
ncbi:hypothetical protein SDC9_161292 [bioreactor metagenome]|uniref:Uncharacterized protein n=1 Tax=bioreactor metagenome TaxID=1076179 RepID=A0A645FJX8_9ZZZZ